MKNFNLALFLCLMCLCTAAAGQSYNLGFPAGTAVNGRYFNGDKSIYTPGVLVSQSKTDSLPAIVNSFQGDAELSGNWAGVLAFASEAPERFTWLKELSPGSYTVYVYSIGSAEITVSVGNQYKRAAAPDGGSLQMHVAHITTTKPGLLNVICRAYGGAEVVKIAAIEVLPFGELPFYLAPYGVQN